MIDHLPHEPDGGGIVAEDVIADVLDRVGGWVRADELLRQLAKRGIVCSEAELLNVVFALEGEGRVRSTLYFQAVSTP